MTIQREENPTGHDKSQSYEERDDAYRALWTDKENTDAKEKQGNAKANKRPGTISTGFLK